MWIGGGAWLMKSVGRAVVARSHQPAMCGQSHICRVSGHGGRMGSTSDQWVERKTDGRSLMRIAATRERAEADQSIKGRRVGPSTQMRRPAAESGLAEHRGRAQTTRPRSAKNNARPDPGDQRWTRGIRRPRIHDRSSSDEIHPSASTGPPLSHRSEVRAMLDTKLMSYKGTEKPREEVR